MNQPDTSLLGTTLAERYEVIAEIGQGAMGAVYEARHTVLGRRLALKVLKQDVSNPRLKERFFREAKSAGAINHQHIVQVYDFGVVPDSAEPYIVMEFVDGETLQGYMDRQKQLPVEDAVEITMQMLSAMDVVHGTGIIHRDIKPSNIILVTARRPKLFVKLVDFGIAKAVNESQDWPSLTRVDEVLGTPVYLSPEQALGRTADPRWDLWALAIILYEMLAGRLPFPVKSLAQITEDILKHNFTPLREVRPDVPRWLEVVIDKGLCREQDDRFASAAEFLEVMEAGPDSELARAAAAADTDQEVELAEGDVELLEGANGAGAAPAAEEDPAMAEAMAEAQRLLGDDADALGSPDELLDEFAFPEDGAKTVMQELPPSVVTELAERAAQARAAENQQKAADAEAALSTAATAPPAQSGRAAPARAQVEVEVEGKGRRIWLPLALALGLLLVGGSLAYFLLLR